VLNLFNRFVLVVIWLLLLLASAYLAIRPLEVLAQVQGMLDGVYTQLLAWYEINSTNFLVGQISVGVLTTLIFGGLLWLEIWPRRQRGVRIPNREGGMVELDTKSVERRLAWHLDQLAEVITVIPDVKARGSQVDIRLELETTPDIDVPMKTDEVVEVTRDIIEQDMGLRLGRLDVRIHHAPFEEEWAA
jgi:hypothetical protein